MTKVVYQHEILKLDIPDDQIEEVLNLRTGGIGFDLPSVAGGRYVFSIYDLNSKAVMVTYMISPVDPVIMRSFFVAPLHHQFFVPAGAEAYPLGALAHPKGLLALYEVRNAAS